MMTFRQLRDRYYDYQEKRMIRRVLKSIKPVTFTVTFVYEYWPDLFFEEEAMQGHA